MPQRDAILVHFEQHRGVLARAEAGHQHLAQVAKHAAQISFLGPRVGDPFGNRAGVVRGQQREQDQLARAVRAPAKLLQQREPDHDLADRLGTQQGDSVTDAQNRPAGAIMQCRVGRAQDLQRHAVIL